MSFAEEDVAEKPRLRILGLRVAALAEILAFFAVALAIDGLLLNGNRFAGINPHPFWIVVLLASAQYGTNEGLAAAVIASALLLVGNLPEQGFSEDLYSWLLRVTGLPVLWFVAAVVLGEICGGHRRERDALREKMAAIREQTRAISDAYDRLSRIKEGLEARVAGQVRTVRAMYSASRSIDRQDTGEVLIGITGLVQSVLNPVKFSLFLLNRDRLEAAAHEGWAQQDRYAREFDSKSVLFEMIVGRREVLVGVNPEHEAILNGEGILAGPLVSDDTGTVVGMLKIEDIPFLELNPATVQNFAIVCSWIGTAYDNAQRFERLQSEQRITRRAAEVIAP
jgi:polysaccharide biosynthesis protein PelD